MVEFHYPGYNYCGPGTNIDIDRVPVDEIDAACKIHDHDYNKIARKRRDYYWRYSEADKNFLKRISGSKRNVAHWASWLFLLKRAFNKMADMQMIVAPRQREITDYYRNAKRRNVRRSPQKRARSGSPVLMIDDRPHGARNHKYNIALMPLRSGGGIRHGIRRRFKRRRRGRRRDSFYKRVLKVINPVKVYIGRKIDRAIGTKNAADYINLGCHIKNSDGSKIEYSPGTFNLITNALLNTQTKSGAGTYSSWNTQEGYYTKELHKWLVSNNSNVTMKFEVYYVKHVGTNQNNPFYSFMTNTLTIDSLGATSYFTATGIVKQNRAGSVDGPDMSTEPHYNLMTDKYLNKLISDRYKIKKGKSFVLNPGQTTTVKYKQKKYRFWNVARLFTTDAVPNIIYFPERAVEVYIRYVGDILPAAANSTDAGINAGDVTIDHRIWVQTLTKMNQVNNKYIENSTENETSGNLSVFGFDNNAAATAV